MFSPHFH